MTTSMLPTMAGTSAIRQPRQMALVVLRFEKLDERARTRKGTMSLCCPADHVEAHLAARAFGLDVGFAGRQMPGQLDAMRALGRGVSLQALFDDLDALHDFEHAHHEPMPAIADAPLPAAPRRETAESRP